MKIEEIRELVSLLEESKLNVLEVSEGESRIRLEKAAPIVTASLPAAVPVMSVGGGAAAGTGVSSVPQEPTGSEPDGEKVHSGKPVKSPIVGVFYSAPSPGEEPFVHVGSKVQKGDVLCIVEAMKLMNEISAEESGEIAEICVEDGDVVEFGEPLFYIK